MKINKVVILSILLIASLAVNYFLYKENSSFKAGHGAEYQLAVRSAIHELDEDSFNIIVEELKTGNQRPYERWKKDIGFINSNLRKSGNIHFNLLGDQLNHISYQVGELTDGNNDLEKEEELIREQVLFFYGVLSEVEEDLEEDLMRWYREISNDNSNTSKYVEEQLKTVINY
ncbi:hypothetical protein QA612_07730 [Evansella sp. AB-P1]|uniref:hypothetical protein n=1 Tax=Evansella sp. AB-P1 TaxID=3037653 RepID=UPI00241F6891|nr:hypothetical protein [Evansella sp. AB-P1]MDG5787381.1 hypothetical protein [Evansella sp. AB-P1]